MKKNSPVIRKRSEQIPPASPSSPLPSAEQGGQNPEHIHLQPPLSEQEGQSRDHRTKHTYHTHLYQFVQDVLVVCPHCAGRALVKTGDFQNLKYEVQGVRVVCAQCGYNRSLQAVPMRSQHLVFGAPVDPFFHLPLWLQTGWEGHVLWAYNVAHVAFLEQHVWAKLRERNGFQYRVKSIGARLPRWMTSAQHREAVLKALQKMKER